jgi:PAS domain S-box-containing protein
MSRWPVAGGECGRIVREKDWSDHPLGPSASWPAGLKGTVETILACSFPLIVLWGEDLYQLYNGAYAEIMGSRHPAGMGQKTSECWPEVWDFNRRVYARVFRGETVDFSDQLLRLFREGSLQDYFFDLCYSPMRTEEGEVGGVLVTVFDVTERHRTAAALQQNIHRLNALVAATSYATYIMTPDWTEMQQMEGAGFLADAPHGNKHWLQDYIHPEDQQEVLRKVAEALATGTAFEMEHRVFRADGSSAWTLSRAVPIRAEDGSIKEWFGAATDITGLHLRDKRLGELAAIVESSDDVIISKDLNGIINSWNASATRLFGYEPEEIIGKSILTLIPEHLQSDEPKILSEIRAGRSIEHFETVRRKRSGELIDVSLTISPVKNARGEIIGASKILRDISARKRMEESLLQAEKIAATGRMAATIAHEVNNPLEAITNLLYLAKVKSTDTEVLGYLNTAENELSRVSHIAKQTLGYYREHASASPRSLAEIARDAAAIYAPRCRAAGIEVALRIHSERKLTIRRGEMMQVVSNLIANSIYAMPGGGKLEILVGDTAAPEGVELVVCDSGSGIPPDTMPRVFEAFFTTRSTIGTGIGLFVAKQFVEGHGGSISIESDTSAQKHGTAVRVFLPVNTSYSS